MPAIEISAADIARAHAAGKGVVKHTPVTASAALSDQTGGDIVLKAENMQRTGSFKIRGAMSKLSALGDLAKTGVTAGSAGNHAQALAFAARTFGVPCEIFVPKNAPIAKIAACRAYGATVVEGGDSLDEAVAAARARATEKGMQFCHPYDDAVVVAGQATLGLELIIDIPNLRRVLVPLGGGGLASGVAIAVKQHDPTIKVIGVQVEACAPYANSAPPTGPVFTLADGIAVKKPGEITRPLIEKWLDDIVVVDEDAVADDWRARGLGGGEGFVAFAVEGNEEAAEIDAFHRGSDRRHDDLGNEAVDDFSEGRTDDHADGEVDDISTGDEFTEFLGDFHLRGVKTESCGLPKKKRAGLCPGQPMIWRRFPVMRPS